MTTSITPNEVPRESLKRRVWVVYQLRLRGTSLRQVAIAAGVSPQGLSRALTQPSQKSEQIIAKALGLKVEDLFPERFDDDGRRLYRTTRSRRVANA